MATPAVFAPANSPLPARFPAELARTLGLSPRHGLSRLRGHRGAGKARDQAWIGNEGRRVDSDGAAACLALPSAPELHEMSVQIPSI